jgi:uncharacterized protein (UPF0276 family)
VTDSLLPRLGVGLGLRPEVAPHLVAHRDRIDFLEIIAEHFFDPTRDARRQLAALGRFFPLVPHSIGLSLGSVEPPPDAYVARLARLVREVDAPWFSDHICYTRAGDVDVGHLAPLPRTADAADLVAHNAAAVRARVGAPMLLENIAYVVEPPGSALDEVDFVTRAVRGGGCDLLLDLTNLHANAINHGYDPYEWLDRAPLDLVVQVHVTGGHWREGVLVDSHSRATPDDVWALLEYVAARADVRGVLLERDERFPSFGELLDELDRAREALAAGERARGTRGA